MNWDPAARPGDADPGQITRLAQRRRLRVTAVVVLVAVVVGVVMGVTEGQHGGDRPSGAGSPVLDVVTTALSGAGAVLIIATLWWAWRTGALRRSRQSPLWGVDRVQRRQVMRAIRGRRDTDPQHHWLAVDTARAMVSRRWTVVMWAGVALTTVGQLVTPRPSVVHLLGAVTAACLVIAAAQTLVDIGRAQRFLNRCDTVDDGGMPDPAGGGGDQ